MSDSTSICTRELSPEALSVCRAAMHWHRSVGRRLALQFLFAFDSRGDWENPGEAYRDFRELISEEEPIGSFSDVARGKKAVEFSDETAEFEPWDYADAIIRGVCSQRQELDSLIISAVKNWTIERMSRIDRNLLRIAAWEMRSQINRQDAPSEKEATTIAALKDAAISPAVSINEAIELGKLYGKGDSGRFINGVLDRIRQDLMGAVSAPEA